MDIKEAIFARRSVRKYKMDSIVKLDVVKELICAAQQAPSACNRQGARFIYIDDRDLILKIHERGGASFLKNVSQAILVIYDNRTDNTEYHDHFQSAAAAIENLILCAHSLNIGTCWICHLPPKRELRRLFGIPRYFDPIALVTLGRYDRLPKMPLRKDITKILSLNKYDFVEPEEPFSWVRLRVRSVLRKLYYALPCRGLLNSFVGKYEKKFDN